MQAGTVMMVRLSQECIMSRHAPMADVSTKETQSYPTIAVVVPNYNDAPTLPTCLDSILRQSFPSRQVIFVDDASTDSSIDVARARLEGVAGAEVIACPQRLGTMDALNMGLSRVTSDYVLFLASNDYLADGLFARAASCITSAGIPGVWSAMVWTAGSGDRPINVHPSAVVATCDTFISPQECRRLAFLLGNWFTGTTLIYHADTLRKIGGFDTHFRGLADLFAALTIASLKGASFSPAPLGVMRTHGGGYLWKTLIDMPLVDAILDRLDTTGPVMSPDLFNAQFLARTRHRIRHAAIKACSDQAWLDYAASWPGLRYRCLAALGPMLSASRILRDLTAYFLLRPFDVLPAIRYRAFRNLILTARRLLFSHDA